MPWFYLNIQCDGEFIEAEEAAEFSDIDAARREAVRSVRSLVSADVYAGILHLDLSVEIGDVNRIQLESISFDDAITTIPSSRTGPAR